jgi:cupin superfamily acireductone dioxygenase involved in methionine salvage
LDPNAKGEGEPDETIEAVEKFEKTYDRTEAEIIAEGQAKVDALRKEQGIKSQDELDAERKKKGEPKQEKIAKMKATGHFNPQPKKGK